MAHLLQLEDFALTPEAIPAAVGIAEPPEEVRLAAYEEGYKAGWDDASSTEQANRDRVGAALSKNLEDLSFTFTEARQHVLDGIAPLLSLMAEKILPEMAHEMFAQTVLEHAMRAAGQAADRPVELAVNPENLAAVESLMGPAPAFPLTLTADPTLGPEQAFLRHAQGESSVDIGVLCDTMTEAVAGFLNQSAKEAQNVG